VTPSSLSLSLSLSLYEDDVNFNPEIYLSSQWAGPEAAILAPPFEQGPASDFSDFDGFTLSPEPSGKQQPDFAFSEDEPVDEIIVLGVKPKKNNYDPFGWGEINDGSGIIDNLNIFFSFLRSC